MRVLLILALAIVLLPSCRPSVPLAPEEPAVILLSPNNGEVRDAGDIEVRVYIQNFQIVPDTGQPKQAHEGHIIYYLDAGAPLEPGVPATTTPGTFAASSETSYTWQNVPAGKHIFIVQLVNNDNTPLDPPVTVRAEITLNYLKL